MSVRIPNIIPVVSAMMLAAGCGASRAVPDNAVSVSPAPYLAMPDIAGTVSADFRIEVPEHFLGRRERLVIVPKIMKDTSVVAELKPVAIDAPVYTEKMHRIEVLEGYSDGFAGYRRTLENVSDSVLVMYRDTAVLGGMADGSRIVLFVTSDGCGSCRALDTLDAGGITDPAALLDRDALRIKASVPEFVVRPKIREGHGEAVLKFRINRADIDFSIGRNREEMDKVLAALQPVIADSLATLTEVSIYGMASADGSLPFNTRLAEARAASAGRWLTSRLENITPAQKKCFLIGSRPEGWQPVLAAMTAAGDKDSVLVKEILEKYPDSNDDVQERYIRRLPCWDNIKTKYLQNDRKVEYVYTYSIKSFTTDAEMLEMYDTRPDAFNEEELLRVSTLKNGPEEKAEVYRTILYYYPQSQVAANNLAIMLRDAGAGEDADELLSRLPDYRPETLNTHAVVKADSGDMETAMEMLERCDSLPEARYNLGLLEAMLGNYEEGYGLLKPFGDANAAVAAIRLGKYEEAAAILDALDDISPRAEYLRAITAAVFSDDEAFFTHLDAAVCDEGLRRRAITDAFFDRYRNDGRFNMTTGEAGL